MLGDLISEPLAVAPRVGSHDGGTYDADLTAGNHFSGNLCTFDLQAFHVFAIGTRCRIVRSKSIASGATSFNLEESPATCAVCHSVTITAYIPLNLLTHGNCRILHGVDRRPQLRAGWALQFRARIGTERSRPSAPSAFSTVPPLPPVRNLCGATSPM